MFNKVEKRKNEDLIKKLVIIISSICIVFFTIAGVNSHILIIGDSMNDLPVERQETYMIYQKLISEGYPVVLLVGDNATSENIVKGMYGADAIIYIGHGCDLDYYNNAGGISKAPYALPTSDNSGIWTQGNLLSEGLNIFGFNYNGNFVPPFKKGASVFFIHTCFATGWVQDTYVANPDETLYKFNIPYVNSGANVYSSGYYQVYDGGFFDGVLGNQLAQGGERPLTFREANSLANPEDKIDTNNYKEYENMSYFTNENGGSLFIGNLDSYVLPPVSNCSEYDSNAADNWYNSGKPLDDPIYNESVGISTSKNPLDALYDDLISKVHDFLNIFSDFFDSIHYFIDEIIGFINSIFYIFS